LPYISITDGETSAYRRKQGEYKGFVYLSVWQTIVIYFQFVIKLTE